MNVGGVDRVEEGEAGDVIPMGVADEDVDGFHFCRVDGGSELPNAGPSVDDHQVFAMANF